MTLEFANPVEEVMSILKPNQAAIDLVAEITTFREGEAQAICWHDGAEHTFTLRLSIDEFGCRSIVGGVKVRGRYICEGHEYDAVASFVGDPDDRPIVDPPSSWCPLDDAVISAMEEHEATDQLVVEGYFDEVPLPAPDRWPHLTDAQLLAEYGTGADE